MNLKLINGRFAQAEAMDILTQLIQVKIKYHEGKIENTHNEEDIKMREQRIKQLQQDFYDLKQSILDKKGNCEIVAEIRIN